MLRFAALAALAFLGPLGCQRPAPTPERHGGVRVDLPGWPLRRLEGDAGAGFVQRAERAGGRLARRIRLGWEADARREPVSGEEAVRQLLRSTAARPGRPAGGGAVDGHPAVRIERLAAAAQASGEPRADDLQAEGLAGSAWVWRCEKTGRLFSLELDGAGADLDDLAAGVQCHTYGDRPAEGEVPPASATVLGPGWRLARRLPAAAVWLGEDAMLWIGAGQLPLPPEDLVEAAHLAPPLVRAAGLAEPVVLSGGRVRGPQAHPALRLEGEARLDGQPVRWALAWWRCLVRGRSFVSLVATSALAKPPAAAGPPSQGAAREAGDDPRLQAVLTSPRCHG